MNLLFLLLILVMLGIGLVSFLLIEVRAFKTSIWWGLGTFLLTPVFLAFIIMHWRVAGKPFLALILSTLATVAIAVAAINSSPGAKRGFWDAYHKEMAKRSGAAAASDESREGRPREARDLAAGEAPVSATPRPVAIDPHPAERAALVKHGAEVSALYAELNAERAKLKKGAPEVAAFNVKAAKYQEKLAALTAEQTQLEALDRPAAAVPPGGQAPPAAVAPGANPKEAEASAALARLRASATSADYAGFAGTLKICLAEYRQTTVFPQIAATARGTLANATPDKLAAAIQAQGAAARAEKESAMKKVRAIVNQKPPTVPKPPRDADTYHYGFHPGALDPDYANADLYSTRELWKGEFVYMDTAPNVYYRSADCEFNPQTKFFFTDRNVPKKKLTDAEVAEVVRLYRLIAADDKTLAAQPRRLQDAKAASAELLALNKQLMASR